MTTEAQLAQKLGLYARGDSKIKVDLLETKSRLKPRDFIPFYGRKSYERRNQPDPNLSLPQEFQGELDSIRTRVKLNKGLLEDFNLVAFVGAGLAGFYLGLYLGVRHYFNNVFVNQ